MDIRMASSPAVEIDGYEKSASSSFRLARFALFVDLVHSIAMTDRPLRILDVGGVEVYWKDKRKLISRPTEITLTNLDAEPFVKPGFVSLRANACNMSEFADNSFDVIHSNSVIEHV